jgi:hypothetical protein
MIDNDRSSLLKSTLPEIANVEESIQNLKNVITANSYSLSHDNVKMTPLNKTSSLMPEEIT